MEDSDRGRQEVTQDLLRHVGKKFAILARGGSVFEVIAVNKYVAVICWRATDQYSSDVFESLRLKRLRQLVNCASPHEVTQ